MLRGIGNSITQFRRRRSTYNPVTGLGNVALWLRADEGVTFVSNTASAWADQSGAGDAGRNFTAQTNNVPYTAANTLYNNQPTMGDFSSIACMFKSLAWNQTLSTYTIIVFGHASAASNRYFATQSETDYSAIINGSGDLSMLYGSGGTLGPHLATGPTSPALMIGEFNGASSKLFLDAVLTPGATGTTAGSTIGAVPYTLGTYHGGGVGFGVTAIAEVLVLSGAWSALTTDQKVAFGNYINTRYAKSINT